MTEPEFKVGDKVHIPASRPVVESLRGAKGTVVEVYPGTGPGTRFVGPGGRLEWSTRADYLVAFGSPIGTRRIDEAPLEPEKV